MTRKFLQVCAGLLMLSAAYALGAHTASAGARRADFVGLSVYGGELSPGTAAITADGDIYCRPGVPHRWFTMEPMDWTFAGNVQDPALQR